MTVQEEELAEHSSGEGLTAEQSVVVSVKNAHCLKTKPTAVVTPASFSGKLGLSLQGKQRNELTGIWQCPSCTKQSASSADPPNPPICSL